MNLEDNINCTTISKIRSYIRQPISDNENPSQIKDLLSEEMNSRKLKNSKLKREELQIFQEDTEEIKKKKIQIKKLFSLELPRNAEKKEKERNEGNDFKTKIFVKKLFIVLNKKNHLNLLLGFSKLKTVLYINKRTEQIIDTIKLRLNSINYLIRLIKNKQSRDTGFSKRKAFFRWRIKVDFNIPKNMITKILIYQPIRLASIYRLKMISEQKEYDRNLKFLTFVAKITILLKNAILRDSFEIKKLAFKKIHFFSLGETEKMRLTQILSFVDLFNRKQKEKSVNLFEMLINNNIVLFFMNKLKNSFLSKKRECLKKFVFLCKLQKFKEGVYFIEVVNKMLKKNTSNAFDNFKPLFHVIGNKLIQKRKILLRNYLNKLKKNYFDSDNKQKGFLFYSRFLQKIFDNSSKCFTFDVLKKNSEKIKACVLLAKFYNEKRNKAKKLTLSLLKNNSNQILRNLQSEFFIKLEKKFLLDKKMALKEIKTKIEKEDRIKNAIFTKLKNAFFFNKMYCLNKLFINSKEQKMEIKQKIVLLLKLFYKNKIFQVYNILKDNNEENKNKIKKAIKNLIANKKRELKEVLVLLMNNQKSEKEKYLQLENFDSYLQNSKIDYQTKISQNSYLSETEFEKEKNKKNANLVIFESQNFSGFMRKKEKNVFQNNFNFSSSKKIFEKQNNFQNLFSVYLKKTVDNKNSLQKLKSFFLIENFSHNKKIFTYFLRRIMLTKKRNCIRNVLAKLGQNKKISYLLFVLKNIFFNKKLSYLNLIIGNLSKINKKKYFLIFFAKKLIEGYRLKKMRAYRKLRYPEEEKEIKKIACENLRTALLKIISKTKKNSFKKLSQKSPLIVSRKLNKIKNILLKKNHYVLEETFFLLKAYKSKNFLFYLQNPQYLVKINEIVKKQKINQELIAITLKHPCYLILKENAGKAHDKNIKDLENFLYLFRNLPRSLLIIKKSKMNFFDVFIYAKNKDKSILDEEYKILEEKLLQILKDKLELVQKLNDDNFELIKQNEDIYKFLDSFKNEQKLFEQEIDEINKEKKLLKNEINLEDEINNFSEEDNNNRKKIKDEIENLEKNLHIKKDEKNELIKKIDDLKKELENKNSQKKALTTENKEFEKEIEKKNNLIKEIEEKIFMVKNSKDSISLLLKEIEDLKKKIENCENKEKEEEIKLQKLNSEKISLITQNEKLKNEEKDTQEEIKKLEEEINKNKNFNLDYEKSILNFIQQKEEMEDKLKKLYEKNNDLVSFINISENEESFQKNNNLISNQEVDENLLKPLSQIEENIFFKKQELEKNENEIQLLKNDLENLEKSAKEGQNEKKENEDKLDLIEKELFYKKHNLNNVYILIEKNEKELKNKFSNITELDENLKINNQDKESFKVELNNKEQDLKELKKLLEQWKDLDLNEKKISFIKDEIISNKNQINDNLLKFEQAENDILLKKNLMIQKEKEIEEREEKIKKLNNEINEKYIKLIELERSRKNEKEDDEKRKQQVKAITLLNTRLNDLNYYLNENKKQVENRNKELKEKNETILKNKEDLNKNKNLIIKILTEISEFSEGYNLQSEKNKSNEDFLRNNINKIQKQEQLIKQNYQQILNLQEILERIMNTPKMMESRSIQVDDRNRSRFFLLKNLLNIFNRAFLKKKKSFFDKIRIKYQKKNIYSGKTFKLYEKKKTLKVNKQIQKNDKNNEIDKKQFGLVLLEFFVIKKYFNYFETLRQGIKLKIQRQNLKTLIKWNWVSKLSKDQKIKNSYIKFKEVLFDLTYLMNNKRIKNLSSAFKQIAVFFTVDKVRRRHKVLNKLFQIGLKKEKEKMAYYLKKWHSKKNLDYWKKKFITNLLLKTSLHPQLVIFKMRLYPKQKHYLHPLKMVAIILLKNFLKNKFDAKKIEAMMAIQTTGNYLTNMDYGTYATYGTNVSINTNYIIPANKEEDQEDKEIKMEEGSVIYEDDSKASKESSERRVPIIKISKSDLPIFNFGLNSDRRMSNKLRYNYLVKLVVKNLKQKKYYFYHKLKSFWIEKNQLENQKVKQSLDSDLNKKIEKMNGLIKILIQENIKSKQDLNQKLSLIHNMKNEIFDNKQNLVFVKHHYHWVFLRNIGNIFDKNYITEIQYTFELLKKK